MTAPIPSATVRRTLFSVIQVTGSDGSTTYEVDWHPDLYPVLEMIGPNGEMTDKIIDLAEEISNAEDGSTDED